MSVSSCVNPPWIPFFPLLLVNVQPVKVSQGSTYSELLSVIEEMSREIRPTYAGSKSAMERLKRGDFCYDVALYNAVSGVPCLANACRLEKVPIRCFQNFNTA